VTSSTLGRLLLVGDGDSECESPGRHPVVTVTSDKAMSDELRNRIQEPIEAYRQTAGKLKPACKKAVDSGQIKEGKSIISQPT
jgi:hypothetical protein